MLTVSVLRIEDVLWKSASINEIPGATTELVNGLLFRQLCPPSATPFHSATNGNGPQESNPAHEAEQHPLPPIRIVPRVRRVVLPLPAHQALVQICLWVDLSGEGVLLALPARGVGADVLD